MTNPQDNELGRRGAGYVSTIESSYELNASQHEVLVEIGRLLDELAALEVAVRQQGVVVVGSKGQPRSHPGLADLRAHRALVAKLIAELGLADDVELPEPASIIDALVLRKAVGR